MSDLEVIVARRGQEGEACRYDVRVRTDRGVVLVRGDVGERELAAVEDFVRQALDRREPWLLKAMERAVAELERRREERRARRQPRRRRRST